jgi:hypothetical protein
MPPYVRMNKLLLVPKTEETTSLSALLSTLGIQQEEVAATSTAKRNIVDEEGNVMHELVEAKVQIVVDLGEVREICAIYGRPELSGLVYFVEDDNRVVDIPWEKMQELWEQHIGPIL